MRLRSLLLTASMLLCAPYAVAQTAAPAASESFCNTANLSPSDQTDCVARMSKATTDMDRELIRQAYRDRTAANPNSATAGLPKAAAPAPGAINGRETQPQGEQ